MVLFAFSLGARYCMTGRARKSFEILSKYGKQFLASVYSFVLTERGSYIGGT
jgi:hypothetical protein